MAQIFIIIIGFIIGLSYPLGVEPLFFRPVLSLLGLVLLTAVYLSAGWVLVNLVLKGVFRSADRPVFNSRYARYIGLYRFLLPVIYAVEIFILHWPLVVTEFFKINLVLVTYIIILLPFLVTLILSWIPFIKIDRLLRQSRWSIKEYLIFQFRSYFALVVLPLLVFLLFFDIIDHWDTLNSLVFVYPFIGWLMALGMVFSMYVLAPIFLRLIWTVRPLPPGPLRRRLKMRAAEAGLPINNIFVWHIGRGRMANAMIIGLWHRMRYVIFTDTLINNLSEPEIEAVFGHEIGHARHHHLLLYFLFSVGYIFLLVLAQEFTAQLFDPDSIFVLIELFGLIVLYWSLIFGLMARRFEKQADLFGAQVSGKADYIVSALEKIALINGQARRIKSWLHPSVEKRAEFLRAVQESPAVERRFRRHLKGLIVLFGLFLALGFLGVIRVVAQEINKAPLMRMKLAVHNQAEEMLQKGYRLAEEKDYDEAVRWIEQAINLRSGDPRAYTILGDALSEQAGHITAEARAAYQQAWALHPVHPRLRMYLNEKLKGST